MTITLHGWLLNLVYALASHESMHVSRFGIFIEVVDGDTKPTVAFSDTAHIWKPMITVGRAWLAARFPAEYAAAVLGDGAMEISERKAWAVFKAKTAKRGKIGEGAVARQRTMKL